MPVRVREAPLPAEALLASCRAAGHYTDCYAVDVAMPATHAAYVEAFYTSWLFRIERAILRAWSLPSTDADAAALAAGQREAFAAWRVVARTADQLLLRDMHGRTHSWLMTAGEGATGRTLYFGSAVTPAADSASGAAALGFPYRQLLGFHRRYSRALLAAAAARLERAAARLQCPGP